MSLVLVASTDFLNIYLLMFLLNRFNLYLLVAMLLCVCVCVCVSVPSHFTMAFACNASHGYVATLKRGKS